MTEEATAKKRLLIYGAYGYTGELIARRAVEAGLQPILAGRRPDPLAELAEELGLESRAFRLESPAIVQARLADVGVVLHCAGPFHRTFRVVSEACLRAGAHYLDITGEIEVFESLAARDEAAREAGVVLMPGVGFDVVPSDCLAAHVARRLPEVARLVLVIEGLGTLSRGTATTMVEMIGRGGQERRLGRLVRTVPGARTISVDLGGGARRAVSIPWGDLATAYRSTGAPNIETYAVLPFARRQQLRLSGILRPLLASAVGQALLRSLVRRGKPGPSAAERARGISRIYAEAVAPDGARAAARLLSPEGYRLTAEAAVAIAGRMLAEPPSPGYHTPATAFGPDFVLGLEGVEREDVEPAGL